MSIDCPNHIIVSSKLSKCSILEEFDVAYIASPNRSGGPCKQCQTEWVNGQAPTKDSLTTPMKAIVKANGKIELPTIAEQAKSLAASLIQWAGNGFKNVPANETERRIAICKENKCGLYDEESGRCNGCGCVCSLKATFSHEKCPAELWPELGREYMNQPNPNKCGSCGNR